MESNGLYVGETLSAPPPGALGSKGETPATQAFAREHLQRSVPVSQADGPGSLAPFLQAELNQLPEVPEEDVKRNVSKYI